MDQDKIKEAFAKAKQDVLNLQSQIESLKQEILIVKELIKESSLNVVKPMQIQQTDKPANTQTPPAYKQKTPADISLNSAFQHTPTDEMLQYAPITPYTHISIGNDGVPTDRQTNQQTDRRNQDLQLPETLKFSKEDKISRINHVSELLNSLDSIKKELRRQFKHLTSQEIAVFSCIYDLENQGFIVDYSLISQKMSLSESSIRDYVQKIIKKGIPIIKTKENNKKILLKIDANLKKIASLQTILTLRQI